MKNKRIGLDTNIFVYYLEQHPQFGKYAKKIFLQLSKNEIKTVTSIITLIEMLSLKRPEEEIFELETFFLEIPNLNIVEVGKDVALEAARVRRLYGFSTPDAIQLATCLSQKANVFITNDKRLKKFKELEVVLLEEFKN